jgi:4-aminobutyrate aminotransferase-like enzyme
MIAVQQSPLVLLLSTGILLYGGHYNNVIRFLPPLVLTEEPADKGLNAFEEAVREQERGT